MNRKIISICFCCILTMAGLGKRYLKQANIQRQSDSVSIESVSKNMDIVSFSNFQEGRVISLLLEMENTALYGINGIIKDISICDINTNITLQGNLLKDIHYQKIKKVSSSKITNLSLNIETKQGNQFGLFGDLYQTDSDEYPFVLKGWIVGFQDN